MNRVKKWVGMIMVLLALGVGVLTLFPTTAYAVSPDAHEYGLNPGSDGKVSNLKDQYVFTWVNAAKAELSFKGAPGVVLNIIPNPNGGAQGLKGLLGQRNDFSNPLEQHYVVEGWPEGCHNNIYLNPDGGDMKNGKVKSVNIDIDFAASAEGGCINSGGRENVSAAKPELSTAYFQWVDTGNIELVGAMDITSEASTLDTLSAQYKQDPSDANVFRATSEDGGQCQDRLVVDRAAHTMKFYLMVPNGAIKDGNGYTSQKPAQDFGVAAINIPGCQVVEFRQHNKERSFSVDTQVRVPPQSNLTYVLAQQSNAVKADGTGETTINNPGGEDGVDPDSCESSMDGFTGLWVCPMLTGADKLITATEGIIEKKLQVNTEFTSNEGLHDAWTQLARISSGLLVIVALVMIVTTALGFDVVSSYTLKKMLPRIVIGAIGIWLSWALATTYIGFMNDLGRGISGIMFEPFKNLYTDVSSFSDVNLKYIAAHSFSSSDALTDNTAGLVFTGAFVLFIVTHGGLFAILTAGITVIIAMLVGLFLLALREVIIVFLLVIAPIAVASWMLPNTNKAWKLWSGTFNKLLLLYPLFMGAFTAGKIFALISAQSTEGNNGVIEVLIPMIAYVSPFFFLPALFKLAGNTFNNITGMVNDKGKGLIDKSKGYIDKKQASSYGAMAKANRETARKAQKSRDYANDLTSKSPLGSYRRFRAGGIMPGGRRDVLASASAAARATADKELESSLSGDVGALKAVASGNFKGYRAEEERKIVAKEADITSRLAAGTITAAQAAQERSVQNQKRIVLNESVDRAERLAGKHDGNRHSQAAALMQLANMGMAGEAEFTAVAKAFAGDTTGAAGAVIGAAKAAARSKGSISTSAITYQDGKIGYVNATGDFVPVGTPGADAAKEDAVAQILKGLSSDGYASLSVDASQPGGPEFRDDGVKKYFAGLPRAEQVRLLNDPSIRIPPGAVKAMEKTLPAGSPAFTYDAVAKVWS